MGKPKYLYIDDEESFLVESIANGFRDTGLIDMDCSILKDLKAKELLNFEELKKTIIDLKAKELLNFEELKKTIIDLKAKELLNFEELKKTIITQKPDGLLIDLRLNGGGPNELNFSATTLAQDLRTMFASGELNAFPLILCSTTKNISSIYKKDKTSHDLFDDIFEKDSNIGYGKKSKELLSLSEGYKKINEEQPIELGKILDREDWFNLDGRIFEMVLDENEREVIGKTSDIAQLIIKDLFAHPGVLINEKIVAARLGVDIESSESGWQKIKDDFLPEAKFSGVFSDGWARWWADKVAKKFVELTGEKLHHLNAKQRVELLDKVGFNGLKAAEPLEFCKSTEFWAICEAYEKPLDTLEGFRIYETIGLKPWQESRYMSFKAVCEREGLDRDIKPHPSELERIGYLKEEYEKITKN
jgi:hypothetical protein